MAETTRYRLPMPSNELNQYKRAPPKELLGTYENSVLKKPGAAAQNVVIAEQVWDPANMQMSTAGIVNGLMDATGFINDKTTMQTVNAQGVDEDTLDVWNKSRQAVNECLMARQELAAKPFHSEAPDHYVTTYKTEHLNFGPAVVRDAGDLVRRANPTFDGVKPPKLGRASTNASDIYHAAPLKRTNYALEARMRDDAIADEAGLLATLRATQTAGYFISKKGHDVWVGEKMNKTLVKPALNDNVAPLTTTAHQTYGNFDRSFYKDTEQLPSLEMSAEEEEYVRSRMYPTRHVGMYSTSHAVDFQGQSHLAEVDTKFRKSHHFDKKAGSRQMPRHEPSKRLNNMKVTERPCDVVPGMYTTRSMINNAHFSKTY
mmetsp:Transcript_57545/g.102787  ORF Transcript_57545/g.102787 Transcript_57545/m.102787 type:complete len:373 (-) Transcript_57545:1022-2140(-)